MRKVVLIGAVILGLILLGLGLRLVLLPVRVADRAIGTAEGVVDKTLNARNAVFNYEWFHDLYQGAQQQLANISQLDRQIADLKNEYGGKSRVEWDKDGKERLAFLEDTRNSYVMNYNRLVADYNAASSKLNRALFKDRGLPYRLEPLQ